MKKKNEIISFDDYLDNRHGKEGTVTRTKWEAGFEAFKVGALLEEARVKMGLTQQELADKCGTNKAYISRIENDASDIKLSTLIRIVNKGLGGQIRLVLPGMQE
jgi:DNA-binding XRE family transcriptional regulator